MGSKIGVDKVAAGRIGISYEEYLEKKSACLKWCGTCRQFKPLSDFCKDSSRTDGLSTKCQSCRRKDILQPDRVSIIERRKMAQIGMYYCSDCGKFVPLAEMAAKNTGLCRLHINERNRKRYKENKNIRMQVYQRNYERKRKLNHIPAWYMKELYEDFGGLCAYCQSEAETIDHLIPVSRGGNSTPCNIVPACKSCNSSKKARDLFEWIDSKKEILNLHPKLFDYIENMYGLYSCVGAEVTNEQTM